MKRLGKTSAVFFFLCAFYIHHTGYAAQPRAPQVLYSERLYNFFSAQGFETEKQTLQNTLSYDFPYNVIVSLRKSEADFGSKKKAVILMPQQFTEEFLDQIADCMHRIQNSGGGAEFVFTANDYSPASQKPDNPLKGLQNPAYENAGTFTYIYNLKTNENTAAFIIGKDKGKTAAPFPVYRKSQIEVIPGGKDENNRGTVVPRFFFKTFIDACIAAEQPYVIRGRFLSLYRLGFIQNEPLVSAWLSADIPALMLNINTANSAAVFDILEHCVDGYADAAVTDSDTHYSVLRFFNKTVWISEYMYVIFLTVSAAVTLFVFFTFSFIRGTHRYIHREEFFKTWYLIPLSVSITAVFLHAAQFLLVKAGTISLIGSPLFFLSVKTLFALSFFSFVFFPLAYYTLKLPLTGFIYGYLLSVAAFLNIFIFAASDIALIPIFVIEYIIVSVSRSVRKIVPLIVCTLFMILPFVPFIRGFQNFNSELHSAFISAASFSENLLYAAILLPFLIMIIRILIRFKLWKRRGPEAKKRIRLRALSAAGIFTLFFVSLFGASFFTRSSEKKHGSPENADTPNISLALERTVQFERSLLTLKVSSVLPVVRYYIEVSSESVLPVFESNYPYDMFLKPFTAVFALDDYPPDPFVLTFSAAGVHNTLCTVIAYVQTDTGIRREELAYTIAGAHK